MENNAPADFRNPAYIRKAGMSALQKELGTVGAVYFLRQFERGSGNYTEERDRLLSDITLGEIAKNVRELDKRHG